MPAKLNLWIVHELYGTPRVFAYCSPSDLVSDPGAVDLFLGCKIAEKSCFANLGRKVGKYVRLQNCFMLRKQTINGLMIQSMVHQVQVKYLKMKIYSIEIVR